MLMIEELKGRHLLKQSIILLLSKAVKRLRMVKETKAVEVVKSRGAAFNHKENMCLLASVWGMCNEEQQYLDGKCGVKV